MKLHLNLSKIDASSNEMSQPIIGSDLYGLGSIAKINMKIEENIINDNF
jgi:hypothetical protein